MISAQNVKKVLLLGPVSGTATQSASYAWQGAGDYAVLTVAASASANTSGSTVVPNVKLEHADGTTYETFRATEYMDTHSVKKQYVYFIPLVGKKKNFKLTLTPGTHTTSDVVVMCATLDIYRTRQGPSAAADMVDSTNDTAFILT